MKEFDMSAVQGFTTSDNMIFAQQHRWLREGGTGCVFSQVLAARREAGAMQWTNLVDNSTSEELVKAGKNSKFMKAVTLSLAEGKDELFSTIFPSVNSSESLAEMVTYLGQQPPFYIDEVTSGRVHENDPKLYNGVYLRMAFPTSAESWPLVLGPYEFFSPSRRAPYTQLIFRPTPIKGNPTTPDTQVGIDDTILPVTPRTFQHLLQKTEHNVAKTRGDFNQELFRARVAVVVPHQAWKQAQVKFKLLN